MTTSVRANPVKNGPAAPIRNSRVSRLILLLFLASVGVIEWILHRQSAKPPESRSARGAGAHDLLALSSAIGDATRPEKSPEAAPLASRNTIEQDVRQL